MHYLLLPTWKDARIPAKLVMKYSQGRYPACFQKQLSSFGKHLVWIFKSICITTRLNKTSLLDGKIHSVVQNKFNNLVTREISPTRISYFCKWFSERNIFLFWYLDHFRFTVQSFFLIPVSSVLVKSEIGYLNFQIFLKWK